jgi:tetratricopeptide (TPR) repeat protein
MLFLRFRVLPHNYILRNCYLQQELQVIEIKKKVLGDEHPDTLVSIGNLALTYQNQGCFREAEELELQLIKTPKRVLGEEHLNTLMSIGNLAAIYQNQGRFREAEELELQLIKTRKRVLGEEHLGTLMSIGNLALTYLLVSQGCTPRCWGNVGCID